VVLTVHTAVLLPSYVGSPGHTLVWGMRAQADSVPDGTRYRFIADTERRRPINAKAV